MEWTIKNGKIQADGKDQYYAYTLWTLVEKEDGLYAERKLILDEEQYPALRRIGFGPEREKAMAGLYSLQNRERVWIKIADAETQSPCVPDEWRKDVGEWLRKCNEHELVEFLGL